MYTKITVSTDFWNSLLTLFVHEKIMLFNIVLKFWDFKRKIEVLWNDNGKNQTSSEFLIFYVNETSRESFMRYFTEFDCKKKWKSHAIFKTYSVVS